MNNSKAGSRIPGAISAPLGLRTDGAFNSYDRMKNTPAYSVEYKKPAEVIADRTENAPMIVAHVGVYFSRRFNKTRAYVDVFPDGCGPDNYVLGVKLWRVVLPDRYVPEIDTASHDPDFMTEMKRGAYSASFRPYKTMKGYDTFIVEFLKTNGTK